MAHRRPSLTIMALLAMPLLGGCVVHAAYDVATVPVKATSKVVDWSTTSRSEADRNRGRRLRKQCKEDRKAAQREARKTGAPPAPMPYECRGV